MRTLTNGTSNYTEVLCLDEPGAGNACHNYKVVSRTATSDQTQLELGEVRFQNGPIQENGVNGVQNEDLLAICIDRLRGFQSGPFACRSNDMALARIEEAMAWLRGRTAEREARGVEGKNQL